MAVTLEIKFTGMFTFVPSSDGKELIVLLPRTGVLSPGNRVHQHHAHLIVERDHAPPRPRHPKQHADCVPESARRGIGSGNPDTREGADHAGHTEAEGGNDEREKMKWEFIPFGRYRVVFTGLAAGPHVTPPAASVDLTPYAGRLDPNQLGPAPDDSVWAQVVLPGATMELSEGETAKWKMGDNDPEDMSHEVRWRTEVADAATVEFWHLGGAKAGKLALKPKKGQTTIYVEIEHLPHTGDRHEGKQCDDAPHFLAYYELFGISKDEPLPVLIEKPARVDDKFTCMTSQGKPGT